MRCQTWINGLVVFCLGIGTAWANDDDVRRADAAQAIINYQADLAEQQRIQALKEAPGTANALATGEAIKRYHEGTTTYSSVLDTLAQEAQLYQIMPPRLNPRLEYYRTSNNPINIDVATLLNQKRLSSQQDQDAVKKLIQNITNAFPTDMSLELSNKLKEAQDAAGGTQPQLTLREQMEFVDRQMSQAHLSVAQRSLLESMKMRLPIPNQQDQKSLLEIMEREATWRVETPEWFNNISVTPKEGILREMAQLEAIKLWMQYQQFRQSERMEVLLATMLSSQSQMAEYINRTFEQLEAMKVEYGAAG